MRHAGDHDVAEVLKESRERLTLLRRPAGYCPYDVTGADLGCHVQLADVTEVIGHPVDQRVGMLTELVGMHELRGLG
jgi:hypothetical protein